MAQSAGILFTDGKLALVGYKSYKGYMTGIGGKKTEKETVFVCAVRETLEEIFGYSRVDETLLHSALQYLQPTNVVTNKGYTHFLCSFESLKMLLVYMNLVGISSPLYPEMPISLEDLLLKRKVKERAELSHLALVPMVASLRVAGHLASDISLCAQLASTT